MYVLCIIVIIYSHKGIHFVCRMYFPFCNVSCNFLLTTYHNMDYFLLKRMNN